MTQAENTLCLVAWLGPMLGLPLLTIAADRARRTTPAAKGEPSWPTLVALTVLLNVAVLGYYFDRTRGTALARWAGFALSILYISVSFGAMVVVVGRLDSVDDDHAGHRRYGEE